MDRSQSAKAVARERISDASAAEWFRMPTDPYVLNAFPTYDVDPLTYDYGIALVPMNIPDDSLEPVRAHGLKPARIGPEVAARVANALVGRVRRACMAGARLICCSEYCYPILRHRTLSKRLAKLAKQYGAYIVAGSYVDTDSTERCLGTCLVFSPHRSEPFVQHKLNRGRFGGKREQIHVPDNLILHVFNTELGRMVVLLCVDVKDPRVLDGLWVLNSNYSTREPVDLAVIPSYTDDVGAIRGASKLLSKTTGTCTVFVNDWSCGGHCEVSVCGERQKGHLRQIGRAGRDHGQAYMYRFDLANHRKRRRTEIPWTQTREIP